MPTYTATDSVDDWDPTTPAGTDSPAEIDDALREIKLVTKAVIKDAHQPKGGHRVAVVYNGSTAAQASVADAWLRRPLETVVDPTSLLTAGSHTNAWKPIAGFYKVSFFVNCYRGDYFAARIGESTSNTTSTLIAGLVSNLGFNDQTSVGEATVVGSGILEADGIKQYCLDAIVDIANAVGFGRALSTATAPFIAGFGAAVPVRNSITFEFLGTNLD